MPGVGPSESSTQGAISGFLIYIYIYMYIRICIYIYIYIYSKSPKVGNPIASILKSNVQGIPALIVLNAVSNFFGVYLGFRKIHGGVNCL